ncbi:hypothetical protein NDU88_000396 [Pleurodeles waltl]|uniref:Uncharacterized protein n=1 Tax=Pleurodeles waltl TaxID=8319 RepID=A0AAV7U702_PLEWA|nr:hypothetical protein NDU88_000396 [Pleurodeles waltl]
MARPSVGAPGITLAPPRGAGGDKEGDGGRTPVGSRPGGRSTVSSGREPLHAGASSTDPRSEPQSTACAVPGAVVFLPPQAATRPPFKLSCCGTGPDTAQLL